MKVSVDEGMIQELSYEEMEGKKAFLNSAVLLLSYAAKKVYPNVKSAGGKITKDGFYCDFDFPNELTLDNMKIIEDEIHKIVREHKMIIQTVMERNSIHDTLSTEDYMISIINEKNENQIALAQIENYIYPSMGSYVVNTSVLKAIKLTNLAGAYWLGEDSNKMLTRIYGIAFPNQKLLKEYEELQEEIKRRDHRKIGKDLKLFELIEEGPGFPFFLPRGMVLKNILIDYWRKIHEREEYEEISTPMILNRKLWEKSGHWEHYRENMYSTYFDNMDYAIKPMNCPGGMLVFNMHPHSYKELPIRIGELGLVHRHEKSGALHCLMRIRAFTQDDAHIFMTKDQVISEIINVIHLIDEVYSKFGFRYTIELSTRPTDSIGSDEDWDMAIHALQYALDLLGMNYSINEGDGAFYGPKIDFHIEDSMGRSWQCGTIQLDFQLPSRFHAEYIGKDGEKHQPVMIHRVVYGSIERFIGILIEHYSGDFPLWLSPVQVKILPIADRFIEYSKTIMSQLKQHGLRCEIDTRIEKIGYKIREAQLDKVPYMIIIGQKEVEENILSIRKRGMGDMGTMKLNNFISLCMEDSN